MPASISVELALIWFAVGFCTGVGWSLGAWLIGKVTR